MIKKIGTIEAIVAINPDAQVTVHGEDYDTIDWNAGTAVISKADIDAKIVDLEAEWTTQEYARNRQAEYPDWGSQLNKIYDDGVTKWKSEMVDPVKAKWPKDNSGPV
jgi:hypothetical protein